jgi:hypothetical protein
MRKLVFGGKNKNWTQMHIKSFQPNIFHKLIKEDGF